MAPTPSIVHLPNGQNLTISPVFGGFFLKSNDLSIHNSVFPAGWTVILHTEEYSDEHGHEGGARKDNATPKEQTRHIRPFKNPTLRNDSLFISSISNPSSNNFKAPTSPTRQIAMMLWATLYWYFHQQEPSPYLTTEASKETSEAGRPKGEWRINLKREGVLRGRNLIQKLERMGLITSEDSIVGLNPEESTPDGWSEMFTSRRTFWQLSAKLFLFTLSPAIAIGFPGSPYGSRPTSPVRGEPSNKSPNKGQSRDAQPLSPGLWSPQAPGPFASGSHLPTYYPPPPLQYTMTSGTRHPMRPKPPRQGETFYMRYIPSIGQYLSFRTASLSTKPVAYNGPISQLTTSYYSGNISSTSALPPSMAASSVHTVATPAPMPNSESVHDTTQMTDLQLLHRWMNLPRVSAFWGCAGPHSVQESFLRTNLTSRHSFPAIGLWDGKPFGYFEIYWVREDILGQYLGNEAGDYDRGLHVLVGDDEFRGPKRVGAWLSSLAHWAFGEDQRTESVVLEPRVDNVRFISHLQTAGFIRQRDIAFPHKQSAFVKLKRENFEAPMI